MKYRWEYDKTSNQVTGLDNGGCRVLKAIPYGSTPEEILRNGSLIAAASELYEIAQEVLATASVETPTALLKLAEAVIKKLTRN